MDREQVLTGIRASIISTKGGIAENALNRDFRNLMGEPIPFRELGYPTLSQFLHSVDFLKFSRGPGGETMIDAIPDQKTGHISDLVSRQKSTTKKSRGRSRPYRGGPTPRFTRPSVRPRPTSLPNYQPAQQLRAPAQARLVQPLMSARTAPPRVKTPPPPRYGNPPIIPQRQPLGETRASSPSQNGLGPAPTTPVPKPAATTPSVQSHQDDVPKPSLAAPRRLDTDKVQKSVQQAQELSVTSHSPAHVTSNAAEDNKKVSTAHFIEKQQEDIACVDIQWLSRRTYSSVRDSKPPILMPVDPSHKMPASKSIGEKLSSMDKPKPPQARLQPKVVFKCFVDELIALAREMNLAEPVFKTKVRRPSHESPVYTAQVAVGNELKLTSFPEERTTSEEATELVAKMALAELVKKKQLRDATLSAPPPSDSVILDRILNIVQSYQNGIFASSVKEQYSEKHQQVLPENWLDIVATCTALTAEKAANSVIIYPISKVQPPQQSISKQQPQQSISNQPPQQTISKQPPQQTISQQPPQQTISQQPPQQTISQQPPQQTISQQPPQQTISQQQPQPPACHNGIVNFTNGIPPKLVLPEDDTWEVCVTIADSSREVWVRLIGEKYDSYYAQVMTDMEMKLINGGEQVMNPEVNGYYVVHLDNCWLRVQLLQITPASEASENVDTADIFLIDNGEEDTVPVTSLCRLDPEFACLPAQAIKCRLAFTEMLTDDTDVTPVLESIIGGSFVAKVLQRPTDDTAASIILYDTSGPGDAIDVNQSVNQKAIARLKQPKLDQKGIIPSKVLLTHVSEGSSLTIQVRNDEVEYLENILEELSGQDLIAVHGVSAYPSPAHLSSPNSTQFLARSSKAPGKWRRGVFAAATSDHREVEVLFIDFGYTESVNICNLLVLDKAYPPLCKFPKQCIQVQLASVPPAQLVPGVVARLRELAPVNLPLIGKVIDLGSGSQLPTVELYKRVPPENMIACINTDLVFNMEKYANSNVEITKKMAGGDAPREKGVQEGLRRNRQHREALSESEKTQNGLGNTRKLFKGLAPPVVPDIGPDYFDVYVTMASNPFNFVVQPLRDSRARNLMMEEMQKLYNDQHKVMPIPSVEELVEGSLFAAFHQQDMHWYRVSINTAVGQTQVSVHFCDFGDMSVVSVDKLRHLDSRFLRLPFQAIKAKISGIKPKDSDWTVEDCLRFQELVVDQELVSQVMEKGPDILSPQDSVIGLRLIDTHDPREDLYIDDLLVREGRAVKL